MWSFVALLVPSFIFGHLEFSLHWCVAVSSCAMCIVQYCLCIMALHDFCCGYNTNVFDRTFSSNSEKKICTLLLHLLNERVLSFPTGSLCITTVSMVLYLSLVLPLFGWQSFKLYGNCCKTICKYNIVAIFAAFKAVNLSNYK